MAFLSRAVYAILYSKLELMEDRVEREQRANDLLQMKNKEIVNLAYYDQLTGLYNRVRFTALIQERLESATGGTLLFLDIRQFRKINALYGVKQGDAIIAALAREITAVLNERSFAAYLGANRFVAYLDMPMHRAKYEAEMEKFRNELNDSLEMAIRLDFYSVCLSVETGAFKIRRFPRENPAS